MGTYVSASLLFLITYMTLKAHLYSVVNLYLATKPSPLGPTRGWDPVRRLSKQKIAMVGGFAATWERDISVSVHKTTGTVTGSSTPTVSYTHLTLPTICSV